VDAFCDTRLCALLACGVRYTSGLALRKPAAIAETSATVGLAGGREIAAIANTQHHTILVQSPDQLALHRHAAPNTLLYQVVHALDGSGALRMSASNTRRPKRLLAA
jgi:hypothetical protein